MYAAQTFTITDANNANGVDVTPAQNSFQLTSGQSFTITLPGRDPYASYTLTSSGFAGALNVSGSCRQPVLTVTYVCGDPQGFTVSNSGGDMLVSQNYTLSQNSLAFFSGIFQVASGSSAFLQLPSGVDASQTVTFTSTRYGISASGQMNCPRVQGDVARLSAGSVETPTPTGGGMDGVTPLDWASVPTCGYNCPPFRLYHTDETGDWEIFRLDGADAQNRETYRRNLSLGEGAGINDMAPSLSPNYEYLVFTSNRATQPGQPENWEIYVASTSGDASSIQRVTYNEHSVDTDPVWGPNNFVVYETTRNGNWDLYMIDMSTGQEYQLTSNAADDINAYWSPDGSKLVFQSDRDGGVWQIYELDMATRNIKRLSSGATIDVDPEYSSDGTHIAYRTYGSSDAASSLAIMNADGSGARLITSPEENATNAAWSPSGRFIAYQSDRDGDLDIYVFEVATGITRQLTANDIPDYAPTWLCNDERVMFTSDIAGDPNIFEDVLPLDAPAVHIEVDADQMTFETSNDIYPRTSPSEENASREGRTVLGAFGEQTSFLRPVVDVTEVDLSMDGVQREDWRELNTCPFGSWTPGTFNTTYSAAGGTQVSPVFAVMGKAQTLWSMGSPLILGIIAFSQAGSSVTYRCCCRWSRSVSHPCISRNRWHTPFTVESGLSLRKTRRCLLTCRASFHHARQPLMPL
ncbi:MAG: hypothetical protein U0694_00455 [Anaerolineae bacterium]